MMGKFRLLALRECRPKRACWLRRLAARYLTATLGPPMKACWSGERLCAVWPSVYGAESSAGTLAWFRAFSDFDALPTTAGGPRDGRVHAAGSVSFAGESGSQGNLCRSP